MQNPDANQKNFLSDRVHSCNYNYSQCVILCCHIYPYKLFVANTLEGLDGLQRLRLTVLQRSALDFSKAALSPHLFPAGHFFLWSESAVQSTLRVNQRTAVVVQTTTMGSSLLSGINYRCAHLKRKLIALGCTRCTSVAVASHKNTHKRAYPWVLS